VGVVVMVPLLDILVGLSLVGTSDDAS
jgi:hypothetical protein